MIRSLRRKRNSEVSKTHNSQTSNTEASVKTSLPPYSGVCDKLLYLDANIKSKQNTLDKINEKIEKSSQEVQILDTVSQILTKTVGERVNSLKAKVEEIVNDGISFVFGLDITLSIETSIKKGKTEYAIRVNQDGVQGSVGSFGGSVLSVVAVTLQVVTIILCGKDKILFLDESLTFVSAEYQERCSMFLSKLCKQLDFTIILISHQPTLGRYADNTYQAYQLKDKSTSFKLVQQ